ncbi:hypothetical protein GCM10010218_07670 [Streptomyces mashuensis]|uniref:Uncharacterized protein n=1 Tax=Streptomyces mashuensis TaxID=33904 RepID=A0A919AVT7_9ACTN|nr:hypothetical protein [Streptomyces mashuensis]GHF28981.1 hypothetical protein GCM10010218_07670 [Streptomyces mashuensis]
MSDQAAAGPAKGGKWKKGCGGCAVGTTVLVGILVAVAASSGGGKQPADRTDAATGSARDGAVARPQPGKAAAQPRTVLTESGSGIKSTAKFTVSGDWDLRYSYDCSSFGTDGNFIVSEGGTLGNTLVNELGAQGKDVTHRLDGGTKYLEVNSECSWKVEAVDLP